MYNNIIMSNKCNTLGVNIGFRRVADLSLSAWARWGKGKPPSQSALKRPLWPFWGHLGWGSA